MYLLLFWIIWQGGFLFAVRSLLPLFLVILATRRK
jgi:hypothetical protein